MMCDRHKTYTEINGIKETVIKQPRVKDEYLYLCNINGLQKLY